MQKSRSIMILEWATLMLTCLVMGVLWGTWFALSRSIESVDPVVFLGIGHVSIDNLGLPMRILMPATIIGMVLLLVVVWRNMLAHWWLVVAALLCMVGVIGVTLAVAVPIDNLIAGWTLETLPPDWTEYRDRWQLVHTIRTFLSIAAVGALAAYSILARTDTVPSKKISTK